MFVTKCFEFIYSHCLQRDTGRKSILFCFYLIPLRLFDILMDNPDRRPFVHYRKLHFNLKCVRGGGDFNIRTSQDDLIKKLSQIFPRIFRWLFTTSALLAAFFAVEKRHQSLEWRKIHLLFHTIKEKKIETV